MPPWCINDPVGNLMIGIISLGAVCQAARRAVRPIIGSIRREESAVLAGEEEVLSIGSIIVSLSMRSIIQSQLSFNMQKWEKQPHPRISSF